MDNEALWMAQTTEQTGDPADQGFPRRNPAGRETDPTEHSGADVRKESDKPPQSWDKAVGAGDAGLGRAEAWPG